ncbi:NADH dehydrogenase [ubiquinone] 1 beta subcomplex subunit 8, mitochondrial [Danaus plexippus]|nr:NADH dehydrogenase [ubiquinone] 1 beta subcomplex subunit 8, mitochondrial [Danaus plexippus]XP_032517883.1 NADH dehydrogenase [ubiquinone] 1 beta subcomplex subunit 8, mitochondrial-like [Danaus plexippus plexippus]
MALSLVKKAILTNPHSLRKTVGIFCNAARNHWNYQYKPGPYPKTMAERQAAAKKYGLSIEEYQPYPEEMGYGDYPKLPDIGTDSKDPHYPYDLPDLKRNFNEPFHVASEIIGEDRFNISVKHRIPMWQQWTWFLGAMFGSYMLYMYLDNYKIGRPVVAKQYPQEGPHYMFCPK